MLADEIRDRLLRHAKQGAQGQMATAWDLAGIAAEGVWKQYQDPNGNPYASIDHWWRQELSGVLTRPEFTHALRMGLALYPIRPTVEASVSEGRRSWGWFKGAFKRLQKGHTTLDEIQRCADANLPLACDILPAHRTFPRSFIVPIPRQEYGRLSARLTRFAIQHGFRTQQEAMLGILRTLEGELPEAYKPFDEAIRDGYFTCRLCGKIPNPPAMVERSGKLRPVCAEPCKALYEKRMNETPRKAGFRRRR